MDDTSEKAQRRVRMIKRDRQNINRIIQHKRDEFEQFIRNGVVSLLNTKEEQRQLAEERSDYFGFLTNRNKQKKARLNSVVNHAKGVTNSAPMGVSSAANIAFGGAGVIGEAIYNNEETHRKETEAENKLSSAQFLHYVPSTDYETIAQQVASLLSYRFQFLLFRLAAGENGYLKLANFLVESMENYAIKRFREHKGKVVNSLINAAIPPTTDAFRYIEWPLKRKKLELDEDANKILDRCGPAVRVLLGAYRERVDPVKGTIKVYKPYTILGALNHASILDTKAEVISGIETQNRKLEQLDGTKKYPMILLGLGETSAHLGVHFATKLTSQVLQGAQIEALERLVPDFFSHEVAYIAQPKLSKLEPLQVDNADLRYPNERFEVPWTATRERDWKERLKHIYEASKQVREEEEVEVVITKHPEKFAAMRFACFSFDAEQAKNDVIRVINEAANAQIAVNETDIKTVGRISKQLNAATAAKYAALAASELMHCIIKCSKLDESYFTLAIKIIETARTALNAARGLPVEEASKYKMAITATDKISRYSETTFHQQNLCRNNLQIIIDYTHNLKGFEPVEKLKLNTRIAESQQLKMLKSQIKENVNLSEKLSNLSRALANYGLGIEDDIQSQVALEEFNTATDGVRAELDNVLPKQDITFYMETIERCVFETKINCDDISLALKVSDYWLKENDRWSSDAQPSTLSRHQIKAKALEEVETAHSQAKDSLDSANNIVNNLDFWQRNVYLNSRIKQDLITYTENAVKAKNASIAILKSIKLRNTDEPANATDQEIDTFLEHATSASEFCMLSFLESKKEPFSALTNKSTSSEDNNKTQLQILVENLHAKTSSLNRAIHREKSKLAVIARDEVSTESEKPTGKMSLQEAAQQARKIRLGITKIKKLTTADIEMLDFAVNTAQHGVDETLHAIQTIRAIDGELSSLQESCSGKIDTTLNVFMPEQKLIAQLESLEAVFSSHDLSPRSPMTVIQPEERVQAALNQLIKNCANKFKLTEQAIKTEILVKLGTLKKQARIEASNIDDCWGVNLVVDTVNWLLKSAPEFDVATICSMEIQAKGHNPSYELTELIASREIIYLDTLAEKFSLESASSSNQIEIAHENSIEHSLVKLVHNCTNSSANFNKSEDEIITEILTTIRILKLKIAECSTTLVDNWRVSLLASIARWALNTGLDMGTQETGVMEALNTVKQIASQEPPALKAARETAMNYIRQANLDVYYAKNKRAANALAPKNDDPEWSLVLNTLRWASRLKDSENRWLQERLAVKPPMALDPDQRRKSPDFRVYELSKSWISFKIDEKKATLGRLNQFTATLKTYKRNLYALQLNYEDSRQKIAPRLDQLNLSHDRLVQLVGIKLTQSEAEKNDLKLFKGSVLSQGVRIHFNAWKNKTEFVQDIRTKAINSGAEKIKKLKKQGEGTNKVNISGNIKQANSNQTIKIIPSIPLTSSEKERKLKLEAENFSIDDIERQLAKLNDQIKHLEKSYQATITPTMNKSHNYSNGFFSNSDSGDGFLSAPASSSPFYRPNANPNSSSSSPQGIFSLSPTKSKGLRSSGLLIEEVRSSNLI